MSDPTFGITAAAVRAFLFQAGTALAAAVLTGLFAVSLPMSDEPAYGSATVLAFGAGALTAIFARRLGQGDGRCLGVVFAAYWMGLAALEVSVWLAFNLFLCTTLVKVGVNAISGKPDDPTPPFPAYMVVAHLWAIIAVVPALIKGIRWNLPGGRPGISGHAVSALLAAALAVPLLWAGGGIAGELASWAGLGFGPEGFAFVGFGTTAGALIGHQIGFVQRPAAG